MVFDTLKKFGIFDCSVRKYFHLYCPACGGTRAVKALLELRPLQSLYCNPLVILFILDVLFVIALRIIEKRRPEIGKHYKARIVFNVALLIIWLGFSLVRNYLLLFMGIDMLGDFYF